MSPPKAHGSVDEAHVARRGFLVISGAKLWFLLSATALNIGLPRLLGDPARFGDYGVVNSFISILNMVMVTGAVQAVSKRVSEQPNQAARIGRDALRIQTWVGGLVFLVVVLGAAPISRLLFRDATLAPYLRIAAVVTLAYAWYACLIGVVNGLKHFATQALFDIAFATMKLVGMIGLVLLGFGVGGAFVGFGSAALLIALVAFVVVGRSVPASPPGAAPAPLLGFMVQVMGYVLCMNVLLQVDVLVVKAAALGPVREALATADSSPWLQGVISRAPELEGAALATEATSFLAGLFRATKNVSLIPYQAVIAITFVVFPLISRATFEEDGPATRTYVQQALRTALLLVVALAAVLSAGGESMLGLLFGESYGLAAPALAPLLAAMACFALLYVVASVLTAAGHPKDALIVMAATAALETAAVYHSVVGAEAGAQTLERASWAVLATTALGLVFAGADVAWRFRVSWPWATTLRAALAAGVALWLARMLPGEPVVPLVMRCGAAGVAFLVVAWATGEITRSDLRLVTSTLRRRGDP